jgi:Protein phosphatase 2C
MSQDQPARMFWQVWTAPKDGHTHDQNEDACRAQLFPSADGAEALMIAIADGASEAVFSRQWARELVQAADTDWPTLVDDQLDQRIQQVREAFAPDLTNVPDSVRFFVVTKLLTQGSQATLLVVTMTGSIETYSFAVRAVSVGDCCLLLFKESGGVCSFPLHHSDDFGANPALVRNRPPNPLAYARLEAELKFGDLLLVCTDAMSKWALQCVENKQAGLLFDALLGLLATVPLGSSQLGEAASVDRTPPRNAKATPEKSSHSHSMTAEDSCHSFKLRRLLRSLKLWSPSEPAKSDQLPDQRIAAPESTPVERNPASENVVADSTQPATPEPAPDPRAKFEQFIASYRAPEKKPRMRNDDSTLVVCLPVHSTKDGQRQQVLEIIRKHKTAAEQQPPVVHPGGTPTQDRTE